MPIDSIVVIHKRVGEKLLVAMDFGTWLSTDETISTISSIVIAGDEGTVTVTSESISGSRVVFFVDGGTGGVRYVCTITITTSTGQTLVGEGQLRVI